jgi:hypothetical protein
MELICTARGEVIESEGTLECAVFLLRMEPLDVGTKLEQRRITGDEQILIATWELVSQTGKTLVLKKQSEYNIELADSFFAEVPAAPIRVLTHTPTRAPESAATYPVLVFAGKNWKLASPKKWVPMNLSLDGCDIIGQITIAGKNYSVFRLPDGFAAYETT